jgi:hypothetical protein
MLLPGQIRSKDKKRWRCFLVEENNDKNGYFSRLLYQNGIMIKIEG